ncbi:MAG: bifunctional riboflavin kinase/FAD synthetase [Bacteriovoracales bacterium]|nr:bifunctional riboflavin kinase/FAD synthetase [Bacteriovoracales bacterium]
MKTIKHISEIKSPFIVTIGNFDGVHKGHQSLFGELKKKSNRDSLKTCAISFYPHPFEVLGSKGNDFLISSYAGKEYLIRDLDIDYFLPLKFTKDFSTKDPGSFIEEHLKSDYLRIIHLGHDFNFGSNKKGNYDFLKNYFSSSSVIVTKQNEFYVDGGGVSSTRIRDLIRRGEMLEAATLLGRPFVFDGIVKEGKGRGRHIGFPTANIERDQMRVCPKLGVYITRVIYQERSYHSVTNVGVNPSFEKRTTPRIETHIFDFNSKLYGEEIQIEFLKIIRPEIKFLSSEDLAFQISKDISSAKEFFLNQGEKRIYD